MMSSVDWDALLLPHVKATMDAASKQAEASIKEMASMLGMYYKYLRSHRLPKKLCAQLVADMQASILPRK